MQIEQMPMVRIFFEKTGRAKYISHLDVMRTLTRAFRRSGLPFWYTQGFNPHLYMTFALPVALGCESLCESVDLRLTEPIPREELIGKVASVLPPGFRITAADSPVMSPADIAWADYKVKLLYRDADPAIMGKWEAFLAKPVIEAVKKTKKGEKIIDLRPHVEGLSASLLPDGLALRLRLAAGAALNISPALLLDAFYRDSGETPQAVSLTRESVLTEDLTPFR